MSDKKEISNNDLMEMISKMYSDITTRLDTQSKLINKNTESIVKLENTLTKKVDILFEAREMDREKLESIENKVDKLVEKTDTQDFEIRMIKKKA
jgi:predicted patatin/cPLA2 family phospholipase